MSAADNGGPAFPHDEIVIGSRGYPPSSGMSMRDYFAAKALPIAFEQTGPNKQGWNGVASVAYAIADAMLKARTA